MTGDMREVCTDLFSPPDPGGTAYKQPRSSSLPPTEERVKGGGDNKRRKGDLEITRERI